MVFDILWALSFNSSIQQQLQSNQPFMMKLAQIERDSSDESMRKIVNGILWNLNSNHGEYAALENRDDTAFDIMISYSHKDEQICKQLYDELIRAGYRVWIDFDQMHGNVMDAMAQAIEQSRMIIICMSEHYRQSNYCRAEAQYAFQHQLKMVPILLQKHYKPDGWLLFLTSQLLYVDFTKNDFSQAIGMLTKELTAVHLCDNTPIVTVQPKRDNLELSTTSSSLTQSQIQAVIFPENVQDWTKAHVHQWLLENNLSHMASIMSDIDGLSLIYLSEYMISGEPQQILSLFQQDSLQRSNQSVSLLELSRFRSLIERNDLASLASIKLSTKLAHNKTVNDHARSCRLM
ncbi:unnamed protein product [Rotaria sp. Silwood2]|nr:unnamed protein product [Rotaria sp. Silwood2]